MLPDLATSLRALAGVIVRIGLNLQPGQPLLITDPYDLHGVHPDAAPLIKAIQAAAGSEVTVIAADPVRLRALVEAGDTRAFESLVRGNTRRMQRHLSAGGAFLFLTGCAPQLLSGLPAHRLGRCDEIKWRHFGPLLQRLIGGETQCTLAPVPTQAWADAACAELPAPDARLATLWRVVAEAFRLAPAPGTDPIAEWQTHLASLARRRDELNATRPRHLRYTGPGTDLSLELPRSHVWCTTQLTTRAGLPFVFNLPTEEVFSAPHRGSARGRVRVARPVVHGGAIIEGIELEFRGGRVVSAQASAGQDLLRRLLSTDAGASRLGEVALVAGPNALARSGRLFHHTLLDENAANHIALGCGYRFCSRAWWPLALNNSQVHLDLPLDATAHLA